MLLSQNYRQDLLAWGAEQESPIDFKLVIYKAQELNTSSTELCKALHYLGFTIQNYITSKNKAWNINDENELLDFIRENEGKLTFADLARMVCGGKYSARQVTGKVAALGLSSLVVSTTYKRFSDEETESLINLLHLGCEYPQIIQELGKSTHSIGRKISYLKKEGLITQRDIDFPVGLAYDTEHLLLAEVARLHSISITLAKFLMRRYKLNCIDFKGAEE